MKHVGHVIRFELDLYVALLRWIARRPAVPRGAQPWSYSRLVTPVILLWIFGSGVEVVVVHVITPWRTVQMVLLGLGVWGLVWMVGMLASLRVYPHLVDDVGVRVRHGRRTEVRIGWERIASVSVVDGDLEGIRNVQPLETDAGVDLRIGVGGRLNVHLELADPIAFAHRGRDLTVTAVTLMVDEPRDFAADLTRRAARVAAG